MSLPVRSLRMGFGFYLTMSAVIHVIGFLFLSVAPTPNPEPEPTETVPAQVQFQEPINRGTTTGVQPEYLEVNDPDYSGDQERGVREATGLPSHMRSSPRPHAYAKGNVTRYVDVPSPDQLSTDIRPPSTMELPDRLQEIEVNLDSMDTIEEIRPVETGGESSDDDYLDLGGESNGESDRRSIVRRSSFPYARAREQLPEREIIVEFTATVESDGSVESVAVRQGNVEEPLKTILKDWIKNWEYERGDQTVTQPVTVRIPGG